MNESVAAMKVSGKCSESVGGICDKRVGGLP